MNDVVSRNEKDGRAQGRHPAIKIHHHQNISSRDECAECAESKQNGDKNKNRDHV